MNIVETELSGVLAIEVDRHGDSRGSFVESWHKEKYARLGVSVDFVQDNISYSRKGVLRGLHYQNPSPQGKLVYVLQGEVFDVAVDIRVGSPSFGKWFGMTLSFENNKQLYIPEGFAHGFVVTSDEATVAYKCTGFYKKECEKTIRWDDPDIGIVWPAGNPILSDKDLAGLSLKDMDARDLFAFDPKL
ncbi:MAG: dTDP-4-dehydrorhamnose 3,5-epimerase [Ignavibacteriales bacterium]|nr:dTDP-4-dehydrorhamnose 3,5-epimerase [Ignavibacteriales bacterium]